MIEIKETQNRNTCCLGESKLYSENGMDSSDGMVSFDRARLVKKYFRQSKSHLVAQMEDYQYLADGRMFDHLIVSRCMSFAKENPQEVLSMFFSVGLHDHGLLDYRIHYFLSVDGDVNMISEDNVHLDGEDEVGLLKDYEPSGYDESGFLRMTDEADRLLLLLDARKQFVKLPKNHQLLQQLSFQGMTL